MARAISDEDLPEFIRALEGYIRAAKELKQPEDHIHQLEARLAVLKIRQYGEADK